MTVAIDFPNNPAPSNGDIYTASNGITYTFQGGRWTGNTALPPTDRLVSNGHEVVLGSDGVLTVGDIVPLTAANKFGSITNPFKDIYVSQGSIVIADQDINTDAVNISNTTGYLVFSRGGLKVTANDNLHEIFQLDNTGKLLIKSEIPILQDSAAFEVVGNLEGTSLGVYNYGVMIHSSGAVDVPSRVYVDGVGTQTSGQSAYAAVIGRHARGTVLSPQAAEADDIIVRFGGNAWANTLGLDSTSNVRIDMVATETQSNTNRGSKIEMWTTPIGSPDPNLSLSVSSDGLIFPYGSTIRDYAYNSGTPANITLTAIGNTSAIWRLLSDGTTEFPNYTFPAAHGTANQVLVDDGDGNLSWVNGPVGYTGSIGNTGYTGSQGDKGDTGTAVELQGSVPTVGDLPVYNIGDNFFGHAWIVTETGDLWFWNSTTTQWDNIGQITGPQGQQGITGYTGSLGSTGYSGSVGFTGSAGYAGNDGYTGSKGDRGYTGSVGYVGSQGVGYTGSLGNTGYTGSAGVVGVGGNILAFVLNGALSLTATNGTTQSLFGLTNGVTLASNTRYYYEAVLTIGQTGGGHPDFLYSLTVGGSGALAKHAYQVEMTSVANRTDYAAGVTMMSNEISTGFSSPVIVCNLGNNWNPIVIRGVIDVTTGGTVNFMITNNKATANFQVTALSNIHLTPVGAIGSNTVAGTWA